MPATDAKAVIVQLEEECASLQKSNRYVEHLYWGKRGESQEKQEKEHTQWRDIFSSNMLVVLTPSFLLSSSASLFPLPFVSFFRKAQEKIAELQQGLEETRDREVAAHVHLTSVVMQVVCVCGGGGGRSRVQVTWWSHDASLLLLLLKAEKAVAERDTFARIVSYLK